MYCIALVAPVRLQLAYGFPRAQLMRGTFSLKQNAVDDSISSLQQDEKYMRLALREARNAFGEGEVPIGAVLVRGGKVISVGRNRVETLHDASAHAEMLCMRAAAAELRSWRLGNSTLYCSVEPCPMCAAALSAFRVDRLVYGSRNPRLGAFEGAMQPAQCVPHPYHTCIDVTGGILAAESSELMRTFFLRCRERRSFDPSRQVSPQSSPARLGRFLADWNVILRHAKRLVGLGNHQGCL